VALFDLPGVGRSHLHRDAEVAEHVLVAFEHPLRAVVVALVVGGEPFADLLEGQEPGGLEQQDDQVEQPFQRVHAARIILAAMVRLRWGTVVGIASERPGAIELRVEVEGMEADGLAYPDLVGPVAAGDRVLLNTTAVALGLGTGGFHLVVAVDADRPAEPGPGRVVKARYQPLQTQVESVEETHAEALERSPGLAG